MNDQRMVTVEFLRRLAGICASHRYRAAESALQGIIDGPGVEPVGMFLSSSISGDHIEWSPSGPPPEGSALYFAVPSAPAPSDDQGPFSKGRLKRLVTQVFGEGWQIVPPKAPVQAVPDAEIERLAREHGTPNTSLSETYTPSLKPLSWQRVSSN